MRNNPLKSALLLLLFLAFPSVSNAEAIDRLMKYAGNIHQFNSIFPQEKVYLQFDNTSYYSGETIWFKAFVVNAHNLQRAQSKVLYVDLISPDGVMLKRQKLKVTAGQADGSFQLMDGSTLQARELRGVTAFPSGFYEIRAYTAFMQNFGDEFIFSRVFAVYDKPKTEGAYYESNPTVTLKNTGVQKKRPETEKLKKLNASFHPEGGHLVLGQPCRVAFKVTDENGLGVDAEGLLEGTDICFSTVHNGMGYFTFTPVERKTTVSLTVNGNSKVFQLPDAETDGCALTVNVSGDTVLADVYFSGMFQDSVLGMTLTCRGELVDFKTIQCRDKMSAVLFDAMQAPEGVCRLTLFDTGGNVLASRNFYHRNSRTSLPSLTVQTDRSSFAPFQQINLKFQLKDGSGAPFRDRFSIAVRDSRSQGSLMIDDIRTSMLLSSDLRGFIEHPDWYFEADDQEHRKALDLLCMVHGWERYNWQIMTGVRPFEEKHRLEKGLTLNGWILNPSGGAPMSNVEVGAAVQPVDKSLSETFSYVTDKSGYFGFDLGVEFNDKARLSISATPEHQRLVGTSARILLERSITPAIREYLPQETVFRGIRKVIETEKNEKQVIDDGLATVINIETGYLLPDVEIEEHRKFIDYYTFNAYDVLTDVEKELDKGEYTTDLAGYLMEKGYQVLFGVAEDGTDSLESINGFEPFLYVHDSRKYRVTGIFESPTKIDTKDIKGIMVYDRPMYKQEAWMLAPLYLEYMSSRIEFLEGRDDKYNRVVMVDVLVKEDYELSTRKEIYKTDRRLATIDGYSRLYDFYAPEYPDGPVFGDVDYRRTLYWNPNVITDSIGEAKVQFYNSSITQHFNVSAAGITAAGQPYSLDRTF